MRLLYIINNISDENINVIKDMMSDGIATSLCKNGSELIFSKFEFHNQLFLLDLSCDIAWDIIKHVRQVKTV